MLARWSQKSQLNISSLIREFPMHMFPRLQKTLMRVLPSEIKLRDSTSRLTMPSLAKISHASAWTLLKLIKAHVAENWSSSLFLWVEVSIDLKISKPLLSRKILMWSKPIATSSVTSYTTRFKAAWRP